MRQLKNSKGEILNVKSKSCTLCGVEKTPEEFGFAVYNNRPGKPVYLYSYCKECRKKKKQETKFRKKIIPESKLCGGCDLILSSKMFYKNSMHPNGLDSRCKACTAEEKKKRYTKRKETIKPIEEGFRKCTVCLNIKTVVNFKIQHNGKDGRSSECRECKRARHRKYKKSNPHKENEAVQRRNAAKIKAKPQWVSKSDLLPFYEEARRMTKETGVKYVVDHIIPLRHPLVCGLHVPANLRVITEELNLRKNNKFIPYAESDFI